MPVRLLGPSFAPGATSFQPAGQFSVKSARPSHNFAASSAPGKDVFFSGSEKTSPALPEHPKSFGTPRDEKNEGNENQAPDIVSRENTPQPQELRASSPQVKDSPAARQAVLNFREKMALGKIIYFNEAEQEQLQNAISATDHATKVAAIETWGLAMDHGLIFSLSNPLVALLKIQMLLPDPDIKRAAIQTMGKALHYNRVKHLTVLNYEQLKQDALSSDPTIQQAARQTLKILDKKHCHSLTRNKTPQGTIQDFQNLGNAIENGTIHYLSKNEYTHLKKSIFSQDPDIQSAAMQTMGIAIKHNIINKLSLNISQKLILAVQSAIPSVQSVAITTIGQAYAKNLITNLPTTTPEQIKIAIFSTNPHLRDAAIFTYPIIIKNKYYQEQKAHSSISSPH